MELDIWDYLTFASILILVIAGLAFVVFLLGLPGRIAIARNHPDAEAVKLMGYLGFLVVVPWVQAFIWAFKPANAIDIRRTPSEEKKAIEEQIAKLKGEGHQPESAPAQPAKTIDHETHEKHEKS